MDSLKNIANQVKGATGSGSTGNNAPAGQKDDYGDKGAAYINKNYLGGKASHDQLEKGTDAAREQIEKMTGKDIPDKFSN